MKKVVKGASKTVKADKPVKDPEKTVIPKGKLMTKAAPAAKSKAKTVKGKK